MKTLILFSLLSYFNLTEDGSGIAKLDCKSDSGRTTFYAEIQDITGLLQSAKFVIDGISLEFDSKTGAYSILDSKNGVYTIYLKTKYDGNPGSQKFVQFWAIPKTFKIIEDSNNKTVYKFKAKIFGSEPRPDKLLIAPVIELNCTLEYEI